MTATGAAVQIVVPTPADFKGLAEMKAAAFVEKGVSQSDDGRAYERYSRESPDKIRHCRVAKSPDSPGEILGAIQLQLHGDPGDYQLSAFMRHEAHPGEAYIEFIACHPDHTGKGIGSKLMSGPSRTAASLAESASSPWRSCRPTRGRSACTSAVASSKSGTRTRTSATFAWRRLSSTVAWGAGTAVASTWKSRCCPKARRARALNQ